jgi:hypothetical protein
MSDERIDAAVGCLRTLATLFTEDELSGIAMEFLPGEQMSLVVRTVAGDQIRIGPLANVVVDPLQAAVDAFDRAQVSLAEDGATRAQARPPCRTGHGHPAICQVVDDVVVLLCPKDMTVLQQVFSLKPE